MDATDSRSSEASCFGHCDVEYYHGERPHQGLNHRILQPGSEVGRGDGVIVCRERLGGILKYYYRTAA